MAVLGDLEAHIRQLEMHCNIVHPIDTLTGWEQAHAGHVRFKTVMYLNKRWKLNLAPKFVRDQLKSCLVCMKNRVRCTDSKLGILNDSSYPGEVLGMDYIGLVRGKYMLTKIDFMSRLVQIDVCDEASARTTLEGIQKWVEVFDLPEVGS